MPQKIAQPQPQPPAPFPPEKIIVRPEYVAINLSFSSPWLFSPRPRRLREAERAMGTRMSLCGRGRLRDEPRSA